MSNNNNNGVNALDILALFGFFIGLENYAENVDQTTLNNAIQGAVGDIHKHLLEQDDKIDLILNELGGVKK